MISRSLLSHCFKRIFLVTVSVAVEAYVDQKNPFNHADLRGLLMIEWE